MRRRLLVRFSPVPTGWCAVDDDNYDGPGSAMGYGPSPCDALADLLEQVEHPSTLTAIYSGRDEPRDFVPQHEDLDP